MKLARYTKVKIDGVERSVSQWCAVLGISYSAVVGRVHAGQSIEDALRVRPKPFTGRPVSNKVRNKPISYRGEERSLREWSDITGIKYHTLRKRLLSGMTMQQAVEAPVDRRRGSWFNERSVVYTIDRKTLLLKDWCVEYGIAYATARMRLQRGMDIVSALTAPRRKSTERTASTHARFVIAFLDANGGEGPNVFRAAPVREALKLGLVRVVQTGAPDDLLVLTPEGRKLAAGAS